MFPKFASRVLLKSKSIMLCKGDVQPGQPWQSRQRLQYLADMTKLEMEVLNNFARLNMLKLGIWYIDV